MSESDWRIEDGVWIRRDGVRVIFKTGYERSWFVIKAKDSHAALRAVNAYYERKGRMLNFKTAASAMKAANKHWQMKEGDTQ